MSETKFTPGPWFHDQPWAGFSNIRQEKTSDMVFAVAAPAPKFGDREYSSEEKEANLHLMASAPDLLAALRIAESFIADELENRTASFFPDPPEDGYLRPATTALDAVRTAIAKAEGAQCS